MFLNSRFGKDKGIGRYTRMCDQKQEYGVLDYMISSPGIFPVINDFLVGDKTPESDHLSLELSLKVKIVSKDDECCNSDCNTHHLPSNLVGKNMNYLRI